MRILTQLRIISAVTIAAVIVLTPMLFWSLGEFKHAKNDYILANLILDNFFERASLRDQYFLYREERVRMQWDQNKVVSDHLMQQAANQFRHANNQEVLERLRRNIEESALIFHRIADNNEKLNAASGNRQVYAELDKRLSSQLLLKANTVRDTATLLKDDSARHVELTYKNLTVTIGLFAFTLALTTILSSTHLGRLIRKRLATLHDGAKLVADGNLNYQIKIEGADEFAELAQSINAMTDKLNKEIMARQNREEQLAEAQTIAKLGSWHVTFGADESQDIWTISKELRRMYGHADDTVIETSTGFAVMPPEDQELTQRYWAEAKRGDGPMQWDHRVIVNGASKWMHVSARFILDAQGKALEASGTNQDITSRKQAEEALRKNEEDLKTIFDTLSEGVALNEIVFDDAGEMVDYRIIQVNEAFYRTADFVAGSTVIGETATRLYGMSVATIKTFWKMHRNSGTTVISEFISPISHRHFSVATSPFVDNRFVTSFQDITERKQAEEVLRESERNLREAQEVGRVGSYVFDIVNDAWQSSSVMDDIFGIGADYPRTLAGWTQILHPDEREAVNSYFSNIIVAHQPFEREYRIVRVSDGAERWVFGHGKIEYDANGVATRMAGIIQDITERKRTEIILQESEARFRAIIEASPVPYALNDDRQNIIYLNAAFTRTFGYTRDDIPTLEQWWPRAYPDPEYRQQVAANWMNNLEKARVSNTPFESMEINIHCKDGSLRTALVGAASLSASFEKTHLVTLYDITERKQAEEQMRGSISLLSATLESAHNAILVVDLNNTWVLHNQQFIELWQITDEIIAARDDATALSYVLNQLQDPEAFLDKVRELYATPDASSFDIVKFRDGKIVERYSIPQRIDDVTVGRVWSFHDVTEQRQLEEALRSNEEKLQAVLNSSEVAIAWANAEGMIEYVNPKFTALFGYTLTDIPNLEQWYLRAYPNPDYRALALTEWNAKIARSLPDKTAIEPMEVDIACNDGQVRHVLLMGSWFGARLLANFSDITELKRTETSLRNSESRYRSLFESSPMCIHEIGMDGKILSMNQSGIRMLGLTDESEVIGLRYLDAVCDADRSRIGGWLSKAYDGETSYFEFKSSDANGTIFRSCFVPVQGSDGRVAKIMGITEDITERKRIEDRIKELNRDFISFLENTSDFIYFKDADSRLRFCSQTLANITGHESWRNMIGKHDMEVFPPDTAKIYYEEELPIFREGKPLLNKIDPYYDAEGNPGWVSTSKWPLLDHEGKVTGLFGISRDITASKQAEQALQKESEKNFVLLRNSSDGIHILDMEGNVIEASDSFCAMLGYTRDEVIGMNVAQWDAQFTDAERTRLVKQQFEQPSRALFETRHRRKDGSVFDVEVSGFPLELDGKPVLFNSSRDITERKFQEAKILDNERELLDILNASPIAVRIAINHGHRVVFWNPRYAELIKSANAANDDPQRYYSRAEDYQEILDELALGNAIFNRPIELHIPGGATVWTLASYMPLEYQGEAAVLGWFFDITERKQQELELLRSNSELEQFSYAISHDMRQPLRMVSSYLQLIQMNLAEKLDPSNRDFFRFAIEGAQRLDQMLLGMLDYSRVGRKSDPFAWLDSRAVLDEAMLFLGPAIAEAQAAIEISGEWPKVWASRDELMRLIQNLIGNAVKYRVPGRAPHIHITSQMQDGLWRLSVQDNGIGIDPTQIGRLFQVFQRLQSRTHFAGNGIGLALCRRIVEHHNGRIWAESAGENQGSTFCIELKQEYPS